MPIIMFHYVKRNSNYYHFNVMAFENFVKKNVSNIVSLRSYLKGDNKNKFVLSFDDGTIDHYNNVFPILKKYNVSGVFSVCDNVFNKKILIIQKIHYLIENKGVNFVYEKLCTYLPKKNFDKYKGLFNDKEKFIKRILQQILTPRQSTKILNKIAFLCKIDFTELKLYIDKEKIFEMQHYGNEFLYHTKNHLFLNQLSYKKQLREIRKIKYYKKKYNFLNIISLPFGVYDMNTLNICQKLHIDNILSINYNNIKAANIITREDCNLYK